LATAASTAIALISAPGASLSLYITDIVVSNGPTAGQVWFGESTGSLQIKVQKLFLGANVGASLNFQTPIKLTANTNFGFSSATCTTHSILVNYYTLA
jgi:hypothetical protein